MPIFASTSIDKSEPRPSSDAAAANSGMGGGDSGGGGQKESPPDSVIGCYELRYGQASSASYFLFHVSHSMVPPCFTCGATFSISQAEGRPVFFSFFTRRLIFPFHTQGDQTRPSSVTPDEFTKYMLYVTQWRWLQCEAYARRHGELGFWSMVHDLSCPQGFFSLWGKTRHLLSKYMSPVEEVCGRYTHPGPQLEPPTCPSDTSLAPPQTPPRTARTFNIPLRFPPPNPPPPPP